MLGQSQSDEDNDTLKRKELLQVFDWGLCGYVFWLVDLAVNGYNTSKFRVNSKDYYSQVPQEQQGWKSLH